MSPRSLRSETTFATVGALIPVLRTRSAREQGPIFFNNVRIVRAFVSRMSAGLPINTRFLLILLLPPLLVTPDCLVSDYSSIGKDLSTGSRAASFRAKCATQHLDLFIQ